MKFKTATDAFENLYPLIMTTGEDYAGTKALFNCSFSLDNPEDKVIKTPERKFKQDYAEYEWKWYLEGNRDAKEIGQIAKIWNNMMIPGTTNVNSNYGYFWNYNSQLRKVVSELRRNKESRRAIVLHYLIHEMDQYKYDTPCNIALNFYIKDGLLNLTVFARSIDLVYGFSNDQYTFAKLMEKVAEELAMPLGNMHWFVTNLHIYPRHYELIK